MATRFYGTVLHRISLALALTASVLIVAACNIADPFASSSGVNYIASQGFDSGQWKVVYSLPTNVTNSWQYLTFSQVSAATAGTTAGLPNASAPLYRLEIPNLVPDGDFEDSTVGVSKWSAVGTTLPTLALDTSSNAIQGTSLDFNLAGDQRLDYQLTGAMLDGLIPTASYRFLFDFAVQNTPYGLFDLTDGDTTSSNSLVPASDQWAVGTAAYTLSKVVDFPVSSSVNPVITLDNTTPVYFSIGMANTAGSAVDNVEEGVFDNLRITRSDIDDYLHLAVPFGSATRGNLIPGTYEFSVWMKLEDPSQVTPQTANAYDASGVTLGIDSERATFSVADLNLGSSTWQKVSMKASVQVDTSLNVSDTAMDLYLSPTNILAKDVGSILVSTPTLTFLPNG